MNLNLKLSLFMVRLVLYILLLTPFSSSSLKVIRTDNNCDINTDIDIDTETDIDNLNKHMTITEQVKIIEIIKKMNKGHRVVNDICEMLEEKNVFWSGTNKPDCRYNISYISNNIIHLYNIYENVRKFIFNRKKIHCKKFEIECGELTLIIKLIDLLNSIVSVSMKITSISDLLVNIEVVSFNEMFDLYISSLDNDEILSNITLRKQRANLILDREQMRLTSIRDQHYIYKIGSNINNYIAEPLKTSLGYIGNTIGNIIGCTLGSAIESTAPAFNISGENKLIVGLFLVVYLLKK